jgi:ribonucleoside-diphosphate reductase alpha chain
MMPRHQAEQSTVKVNKAAEITGAGVGPRRGFGARPTAAASAPATPKPVGFGARAAAPVVPELQVEPVPSIELEVDVVDGAACPVDPQERLQCESCQ